METRAPTRFKVASMVFFAMTCIGLLLFLWIAFGGSLPLASQGYRLKVVFPYSDELATQSDVRISGVSVGDVVALAPAPNGNGMQATLQIKDQFAPLRADTRAILRTKTILGETYVELTPGQPNSPPLQDDSTLPAGHVVSAVQLDQIFDTFDAPTRRAYQVWMQQLGDLIRGNGENVSDVIGNLPGFAHSATDLLTILDVQQAAVKSLIGNGATVFASINRDPAALQSLITHGDQVFATTASVNRALTQTVKNFLRFLVQSRLLFSDLKTFSRNANPVLVQLQGVARQLGPTFTSLQKLSPAAIHLFNDLPPLIRVSRTGLPAVSKVLNGAGPVLGSIGPFLEQLNPILDWLSLHQILLSDFISSGASPLEATTNSFGGGSTGHYLRQYSPVGAETLAIAQNRNANDRGDTYNPVVAYNTAQDFANGGMASWDCSNTGASGDGSIKPGGSNTPCWVAAPLPGAKNGQIPQILAKTYPSK